MRMLYFLRITRHSTINNVKNIDSVTIYMVVYCLMCIAVLHMIECNFSKCKCRNHEMESNFTAVILYLLYLCDINNK